MKNRFGKITLIFLLSIFSITSIMIPSLASSVENCSDLDLEETNTRFNEFTKVKNIEYSAVKNIRAMSDQEIERKFNIIINRYKDKEYTSKELERASKMAERVLNIINNETIDTEYNIKTSNDYYDKYLNDLRKANFVEGILDLDEGMSELQIFAVGFTHANKARDAALDEFPNDAMLCDAFRHFSWKHMSTSDSNVGKLKTRTATINHEWGYILLKPLENTYYAEYQDYINDGYSDEDAAKKAFNDTVASIVNIKHDTILVCEESYKFFKGIFTVSNIMDLYNNCYGRAYPEKYPSLNYTEAFYKAKNNGELILDEDEVDNNNYYEVWASDWYTY